MAPPFNINLVVTEIIDEQGNVEKYIIKDDLFGPIIIIIVCIFCVIVFFKLFHYYVIRRIRRCRMTWRSTGENMAQRSLAGGLTVNYIPNPEGGSIESSSVNSFTFIHNSEDTPMANSVDVNELSSCGSVAEINSRVIQETDELLLQASMKLFGIVGQVYGFGFEEVVIENPSKRHCTRNFEEIEYADESKPAEASCSNKTEPVAPTNLKKKKPPVQGYPFYLFIDGGHLNEDGSNFPTPQMNFFMNFDNPFVKLDKNVCTNEETAILSNNARESVNKLKMEIEAANEAEIMSLNKDGSDEENDRELKSLLPAGCFGNYAVFKEMNFEFDARDDELISQGIEKDGDNEIEYMV